MKPPGRGVVGDIVEIEDPDGNDDPRESRAKGCGVTLPSLSVGFDGNKGDRGHVKSGTESENTDDARLEVRLRVLA